MERRNGAALCPRLIDYFVVVAGRNPSTARRTICTSPEILRRYPLKDHDDFLLPADVSFFCQPEGCLNVTRQQISQLVKNSSFVFCLTDKDTNKVRYGVCYSFYQLRSFESNQQSDAEPEEDKSLLTAPPRHRSRKRYQLISICILSHHPFFTTFRDILVAIKRLIDRYEDRVQRLIRSHHLGRRSIWDFLLTASTNQSLAQLVNQDIREIDTYILRLLSSPVPVPGKTRVEISIGPSSFHPAVIFALPDRTRFSLVDFPIHLILDLFGIDKCLLVLTAILLESKVVLQSRDYNALTMSVLGFISLLYPLEYMFPVIPLLPTCLRGAENLLLAPTPFLIGAPSTFLLYKKDFQLPDDIWLFNLDTGDVSIPTKLERLPSLPEPEGSILKTRFSQALASLSLANVPLADRGNRGLVPSDPDSVDVAIRMAMVRFFVSENVLGNWSDHTRIMRLYPRPVIGFQHNTFLKSRPAGCHFTAQLVKTQAVECFCEWALCPDNEAWLRVLSGLADPSAVGDKSRWFAQSLVPVSFQLLDPQSSLSKRLSIPDGQLNGNLSNTGDPPTDESCSGEESDTGSSASGGNLSINSLQDYVQDILAQGPEPRSDAYGPPTRLSVDEDEVYAPPFELQLPETTLRPFSSAADTTDSEGDASASDLASNSSSRSPSRQDSRRMDSVDSSSGGPPVTIGDVAGGEGSGQRASLAERRGGSRLAPVNIQPQRSSGSSDLDRTPQPDGTHIAPFVNEPTVTSPTDKRVPYSPSGSSSASTESSGVDMTTKDVFAAMKSDVADIAQSAKAKAKNATKQLSGLLDEVAAAKQRHEQNRAKSGSSLPRQGSVQGPARPPPPPPGRSGPNQQPLPQQQGPPQQQPAHIQPLLAASEAIRKHLPSPQQARRVTSKLLTGAGGGPGLSGPPPGFHSSNQNQPSASERTSHVRRSYRASADLAQRQQSIDAKSQMHIENQQFLSEIVQLTFEGQTVGWLKLNRLRKVLEDETYRLFLLSKMNTQLSRKYRDEDSHIEDMVLSRKQFKAFIVVMRAAVSGLETSYRNGAAGGMASAFLLLEVAHTHYWQPEYGLRDPESLLGASASNMSTLTSQSTTSGVGRSMISSPFGSREHLAAVGGGSASGGNTPAREENYPLPTIDSKPVFIDGEQFENLSTTPSSARSSEQHNRPAELPVVSIDSSQAPIRRSSGSPGTPPSDRPVTVGVTSGSGLLKAALLRHGDSSDSLSSTASGASGRQQNPSSPPNDPNIFPKTTLTVGYRYRSAHLVTLPRGMQPSREYLFQHILGKERSWIWDQMGFWEEAFIDSIAHERDLVGYDMNPQEMIQRYGGLPEAERKRLELDEDRLLAVLLFNAASYMLMMGCNKNEIRRKIRRLLGKSHLGLNASQTINQLLDAMNFLNGNDVDLRVPASRLVRRYTFPVHLGTDNSGEMLFVEVCTDSLMLRSVSGQQRDRWWFDRLINMTYSPRTKVLCLWMKNAGDQVELNQFYTRKCRELYNRIKSAMEQTAALNRLSRPGPNLYAEFPVTQMDTGTKAVVQVTPDGVCINEPANSRFIDLCHIKRCYAQHGNVFVLELFDQESGALRQLKMMSDQPNNVAFAIHRVISYQFTRMFSSTTDSPSPSTRPFLHKPFGARSSSLMPSARRQRRQRFVPGHYQSDSEENHNPHFTLKNKKGKGVVIGGQSPVVNSNSANALNYPLSVVVTSTSNDDDLVSSHFCSSITSSASTPSAIATATIPHHQNNNRVLPTSPLTYTAPVNSDITPGDIRRAPSPE